jgi:hypothetical protein
MSDRSCICFREKPRPSFTHPLAPPSLQPVRIKPR